MKIIRKITGIQLWRMCISSKVSIGLVATMGALHKGHMALLDRAKKENDIVVASIFVNPRQFGPQEDFKNYPRTWRKDCRKLRQKAIQILFAPDQNSMYPSHYATEVSIRGLSEVLCGDLAHRGPGHFKGVATVVSKLFNLIRPQKAYFGLKDYQQMRVIEQMNQDLNLGVKIVRCPTVRESDGLAISTRNQYLSPSHRVLAPGLYRALQYGRKLLISSRKLKPPNVRRKIKTVLDSIPHTKVEYVELVDPQTLKRAVPGQRPVLIASAIRLGSTRLIDNMLVS